jgi:hypothetical protein
MVRQSVDEAGIAVFDKLQIGAEAAARKSKFEEGLGILTGTRALPFITPITPPLDGSLDCVTVGFRPTTRWSGAQGMRTPWPNSPPAFSTFAI